MGNLETATGQSEIAVKHLAGPSDQLLEGRRLWCFQAYNFVLAVILGAALVVLVAWGRYGRSVRADGAADPSILLSTLVTLAVAGAAGGALCNLRGVFRWYTEKGGFPREYAVPFYTRPLMGALTGLFTFFVASLVVSSLSVDASQASWETLSGRISFIGLALLAGFAAREFMERLKEVAKTLFSSEPPDKGTRSTD